MTLSDPEKLMVISADGHVGAPLAAYVDYFDDDHRDQVRDLLTDEEDVFLQGQAARASTTMGPGAAGPEAEWAADAPGRYGAWDVALRLQELDRQGVVAEVLVPGHQFATLPLFSVMNRPYPPDLRMAGLRAYHRWLADFMGEADGRLYGQADPGPCLDMDATLEELRWVAEHGFVCVGAPGIIEDATLPPLSDPRYEPFWATCAELDLPLLVHAGWGFPQGRFQDFVAKFLSTHLGAAAAAEVIAERAALDDEARRALVQEFSESPTSPLRLDFGPRRLLWQLMLAGVFDRYPDIRLVLTEVRSDWIPVTLATLDRWCEESGAPLALKPSEYWHRHCYATPSSIHRAEVEARHEVGVDRLMFGMDYPHPEGTWPDTWDWIRVAFAGVPEDEARAILGHNALRCFGLDSDRLAPVAERVGPSPADVLGGGHRVDPRAVEHFHQRAGFARPTEDVDTAAVEQLVAEDALALLSGT
ncbi:MAG TPA: amidohydrolase family protein [Acidimicrobiales bacterium]|nr:amidohydrolase family protein [Acidimicrobiales bacterium]